MNILRILISALFIILIQSKKCNAQSTSTWAIETKEEKAKRMQWWTDARFGMFIHWGISSLPAGEWNGKRVVHGGYAEHLMRIAKIPRAKYLELAHQFNPVNFDADLWVKTAKNAGMRYLIITAKHHDGFAMYRSAVSNFNIIEQTPWKHDPMVDLSKACKKYGLKFGFYYSHAFDWEHPDAPGNDWDYKNPGGDLKLFGGIKWYDFHPELIAKAANYVQEKAIPQIKELLNNYHPDILWFDTPHKLPLSENLRILKAVRDTDSKVIVNGRLVRPDMDTNRLDMGDYRNTGDRPAEFYPVKGNWEAIPTTNESYGYSKYDKSHKSVSFFIRLLAKSASRGGNLLLNIGPMGNGEFAPEDVKILDGLASWMKVNSESIYKTTKTPLPIQNWGVSTRKGNLLYLHVFDKPSNGNLIIAGMKSNIKKAYFLDDISKKALPFTRINALDLNIQMPIKLYDSINTVIVLETIGTIQTDSLRLMANTGLTNQLLAFDAALEGEGFGLGDGKTNQYFVEGWTKMDQIVKWKFRLIQPSTYKIILKYLADENCAGTYEFKLGSYVKNGDIFTSSKSTVTTVDLGLVTLQPGLHTIQIIPLNILKNGLMKLLEIQLIPN